MKEDGFPAREFWLKSVLNRYEGPLVQYAIRMTGNLEQARDIVQETFLRLCREERPCVDGHVAQWLYTVCRNRAIEVLRKENRMQALSESSDQTLPSPAPSPDEVCERRQDNSRVLSMLSRLPANQQEVVRLKFQGGLSYKEIAAVTSLSTSNVGFLLHTALKRIREQLQAADQPGPSAARRMS